MNSSPAAASLRFSPVGDSGLLLRLGDDISASTFDRVMGALAALDASGVWPSRLGRRPARVCVCAGGFRSGDDFTR